MFSGVTGSQQIIDELLLECVMELVQLLTRARLHVWTICWKVG